MKTHSIQNFRRIARTATGFAEAVTGLIGCMAVKSKGRAILLARKHNPTAYNSWMRSRQNASWESRNDCQENHYCLTRSRQRLNLPLLKCAPSNGEYGAVREELSRVMSWEPFEIKRQQAAKEYSASRRPEALEKLCMSEVILEKCQEKLGARLPSATLWKRDPALIGASLLPQWREVLARPVMLRLELARAALDRVTREEKEKLSEYDQEDIVEHSLPIRRAAGVVGSLRSVYYKRFNLLRPSRPESACSTLCSQPTMNKN